MTNPMPLGFNMSVLGTNWRGDSKSPRQYCPFIFQNSLTAIVADALVGVYLFSEKEKALQIHDLKGFFQKIKQ